MMSSLFTVTRINKVAVVTLDNTDSKLNILSTPLVRELQQLLDQLEHDGEVKALIFISGKLDNFIAGAHIEEFLSFKNAQDAKALSQRAQHLMNRIEAFPKPVVCAIRGACLGGGLEMALACHYRIATNHPKTQIGLPEVTLGLLPGAGGAQRLSKLAGVEVALSLMLSGKRLDAVESHKMGLIDRIVSADDLLDVALNAAVNLLSEDLKVTRDKGRRAFTTIEFATSARDWLAFRKAKSEVENTTKGHYPAPLAIIETLEHSARNGFSAGLDFEAQKFAELSQTSQSRNLIRLFFLQNAYKKKTATEHAALKSYASRILAPYLDEAISIALEGVALPEIDRYMEQFGFPVGPFTLMDEMGLDVALNLGPRFGTADRRALDCILQENLLGKKSKKGFYLYDDPSSTLSALSDAIRSGKRQNPKMRDILDAHFQTPVLRSITAQDIQLRIALRMVNEAVLCLEEQVLRNEEDGDVAAILELGFPAFTGGPFNYVRSEGPAKLVATLRRFTDHFGPHFEPASLLMKMAQD
jgi:enoyl-CoA hydratase/carnithine racemase/3-hydroxyacyl-CoA dehydrogenase